MVEVRKITVGIIGYNEGNGHPYSFSAIINGYDSGHIDNCPYPFIANYLKQRSPFEFGVHNLAVDYVWTPYEYISKDISKCCNIPNVANHYIDFIDNVDAVIIARDDAETHKEIAEVFLQKDKYVFIDKPLCKSLDDLNYFMPYLKQEKLMSCSGFRYHPLFLNRQFIDEKREKIVCANAVTTIDWFKYGIHLLEALQPLMNDNIVWVQNIGENENDLVRIQYDNGKYAMIMRNNNINGFCTNFYTSDGNHFEIKYNDNFTYFKNLLFAFHDFITSKKYCYNYLETVNLIKALIASNLSKTKNGKKIYIDELV